VRVCPRADKNLIYLNQLVTFRIHDALTLRRLRAVRLTPYRGDPAAQRATDPVQDRQQGLPPQLPAQKDMVATMRIMHVFRAAIGVMTRRGLHHVQIDDM
jgi:hypothetical protein